MVPRSPILFKTLLSFKLLFYNNIYNFRTWKANHKFNSFCFFFFQIDSLNHWFDSLWLTHLTHSPSASWNPVDGNLKIHEHKNCLGRGIQEKASFRTFIRLATWDKPIVILKSLKIKKCFYFFLKKNYSNKFQNLGRCNVFPFAVSPSHAFR